MLIVPLNHDRSVARRWPWITSVIILRNVTTLSDYSLLAHAELSLELGHCDSARQLYERARSFVSTDVQIDAAIRQGIARTLPANRPSSMPPPA